MKYDDCIKVKGFIRMISCSLALLYRVTCNIAELFTGGLVMELNFLQDGEFVAELATEIVRGYKSIFCWSLDVDVQACICMSIYYVTDIGNCRNGLHNCSQVCIESIGGFECDCDTGYLLLADRTSCIG